jgi:8-oxo-dGTP pyrophosphatase MutT (NUDIX family)
VKRQFSAGGVVFQKTSDSVLWLITKSAPSIEYPNDVWRLQKGWLDDSVDGKSPGPLASGQKKATEEELQNAALREVKEEGGVEAKIIEKMGTETYFFPTPEGRGMKFVTFYLMEWEKDLPEGPGFETSEVKWLAFDEAQKLLTYAGEKKVLEKAKTLLDRRSASSLKI